MRVCMITTSYPRYPGDGAGSFIRGLAEALVQKGVEIEVLAPADPDVEPMDYQGVVVHRFRYAPFDAWHVAGHARALRSDRDVKGFVPLLMPSFCASALGRALWQHHVRPFDLVHGHWAIPGGLLGRTMSGLVGIPLVVSLHGSSVYLAERSKLIGAVTRFVFRGARAVAGCSRDLRDRAVAVGSAEERTFAVPYGVDTSRYCQGKGQTLRAALGLPSDAILIGALGRHVDKKGFEYLVDAMPRILAAYPNAYCVLGGDGYRQVQLQERAEALGVGERVRFPGYISWVQTPEYYRMFDVFAVPSVIDANGNRDGLPNVLLEAMSCGCPVVASRVAGIPDVVRDGATALLVDSRDSEQLADSVIRVLSDDALRERLGLSAREQMAAAYSWGEIADQMIDIYQGALADRG